MQRHRATFDCRLRRRLCTTNQNNCTSTHTGKQVHTHTQTQTYWHADTLLGQPVSVSGTPLKERETTQSVKSEGRSALFGLRTRRETKPTTATTAAQQAKMKSSSGKKKKIIIIKWQLNISLSNRPNSNDSSPCLLSCCLPRSNMHPHSPLLLSLL